MAEKNDLMFSKSKIKIKIEFPNVYAWLIMCTSSYAVKRLADQLNELGSVAVHFGLVITLHFDPSYF